MWRGARGARGARVCLYYYYYYYYYYFASELSAGEAHASRRLTHLPSILLLPLLKKRRILPMMGWLWWQNGNEHQQDNKHLGVLLLGARCGI